MRALLLCVYSMSCSEAHGAVLSMLCRDSSRVLKRVLEMTEEQDVSVATLATCLVLQIATRR